METKLKDLKGIISGESMSKHTTFRTGGNADMFFEPGTEEELCRAFLLAKNENIPVTVVGNGSNLLVRDGGIRGLVIRLGKNFSAITAEGELIVAEAGALLSAIANVALKNELTGFEFAQGIPGSIGGGLYMNAGAYGGSLSDVVEKAEYFKDGEIHTIYNKDMKLGYRESIFSENGGIVTKVYIRLKKGIKEKIAARQEELKRMRAEKQPLEFASAGSTFKRPEGYFAGALIEGAGLKGTACNDAQVSEKHAGFIINRGGATSSDILKLIEIVKAKVFEKYGVELETEVRILGEDN